MSGPFGVRPKGLSCVLLRLIAREIRMKVLQMAAVATAVSVGLCLPAGSHMSGMRVAAASTSPHATVSNHSHGFGFHHFLPGPSNGFLPTHFRFGDFRSHEVGLFTGGAGDFDYAAEEGGYGPDADDDIDNLHFRAQEPFGPGDIGRPPVRAEANAAYLSDRMDPWHGYEPQDW
jgi:hypothetical protein